jgi:hypothetical protein
MSPAGTEADGGHNRHVAPVTLRAQRNQWAAGSRAVMRDGCRAPHSPIEVRHAAAMAEWPLRILGYRHGSQLHRL